MGEFIVAWNPFSKNVLDPVDCHRMLELTRRSVTSSTNFSLRDCLKRVVQSVVVKRELIVVVLSEFPRKHLFEWF
jgi:hypothetical protein